MFPCFSTFLPDSKVKVSNYIKKSRVFLFFYIFTTFRSQSFLVIYSTFQTDIIYNNFLTDSEVRVSLLFILPSLQIQKSEFTCYLFYLPCSFRSQSFLVIYSTFLTDSEVRVSLSSCIPTRSQVYSVILLLLLCL